MDTMQESINKLQQTFVERMDVYQGELQSATPSATIAQLSADFNAFRTFIMTALRSLQEQARLLASQADAMEMRSRRKILLLHGLPEEKNEDTAGIVVKTMVSQLKLSDFSTKDISRCQRLGRLTSVGRPRAILLKLREHHVRSKIWNSKTSLKGSGITLSEFLTKSRHEAFMAARSKFGVTRCWTRDGSVFVIGDGEVRHRITSTDELEKIAAQPIAKPVNVAKEPSVSSKPKRTGAASKK